MEIIKKIVVGLMVLIISAAVFLMLIKEQKVKQDILQTTLELFGKELLAMVPDGPQRRAAEEMINSFLDQAERNNLPKEEIEKTVAQGLNMSLSPQPPTTEELQALFAVRDTRDAPRRPEPPKDRERLAREINTMIALRRQLEQVDKAARMDSLQALMSTRVIFAADSGLKVLVPSEFPRGRHGAPPPEWIERMQQLERDNMVITFEFGRWSGLYRRIDEPLPPEVFAEIVINMQRRGIRSDSLKLPPFVTDPDSLEAFLARIEKASKARHRPR